jgi:tripartite-type tricarboxylate transporter receptor subunit TctC
MEFLKYLYINNWPHPLAAGGGTDVVARVLAERMRGPLGQPIIIENVTGAEGSIGAGRVARARPDGYTITIGFLGSHVVNGAYYSLPYDVINDFAPISLLVTFPIVLFARKTMPAQSLNELIAWLKANPNASAGTFAAGQRLLCAFFRKETMTQFTLVPSRRGRCNAGPHRGPDRPAVFFAGFAAVGTVGKHKGLCPHGRHPLGVGARNPDHGRDGVAVRFLFDLVRKFFVPKATPREIISRLNAAAVEALADPAVRSRFIDLGLEIFPRERQTPEALGALQRSDAEKWWPRIKEFGIKAE